LPTEEKAAARGASTDAFHLAMLIAALLTAAGAATNAIGIRDPQAGQQASAIEPALERS
jgi:hypothetical protein